ncbi:acetyl-CoA carboxylase biotin carboxylase subunit [Ferrovibrio sp.]|uniref:acetyl-CoA carboxylase biotin carboxylase subunit n=1 Tax=Ferrovibrio sp. TaxID=1917215 RepID=UPI003D0BFD50
MPSAALKPKLLVANRGEIACRVIRAARALGLGSVAVYSEADAASPHVALADEAVLIGPAQAQKSYLDAARIIAVAKEYGATLIHPGYGFLAENAAFAEACAEAGIAFVGPTPAQIRLMGDKECARRTAAGAGVPVLPGSDQVPANDEAALHLARGIGYPLLIKAAAGGGGIGMRLVAGEADLLAALAATRNLAGKAFGNEAVYFERYVGRARHIEVQVFGLGAAGAVHLFERECSFQRRHQKVIEEAPAPNLPQAVRQAMAQAAVDLARSLDYLGAGTIEFLYDEASERFYFLEMNTRIQVEHPVTEEITGFDLVAAQIRLALGQTLPDFVQDNIAAKGHAVEARLYAERPAKNFLPAPGLIERLRLEAMPGIRIESGYVEGQKVTPFYDPMIMKIVAHGADRKEALARLDAALAALDIAGIDTNRDFLRRLIAHPEAVAGRAYTRFIEEHLTELVA